MDISRHPLVNITRGTFYHSELCNDSPQLHGISAVLKQHPSDFQVFEVSEGKSDNSIPASDDLLDVSSLCFTYPSEEIELCPPVAPSNVSSPPSTQDLTPTAAVSLDPPPFSALSWLQSLPDNMEARLIALNEQAGTDLLRGEAPPSPPNSSTTLTLPVPQLADRRHKAVVYEHLREHFPFLLASAPTDSDPTAAAPAIIAVTPDLSLLPLIPLGLSPEDVCSLMCFVKAGPQHALAGGGLHIGAGLGRESRTLVYRALGQLVRRLDSKTVDHKGQKSMKVYWRAPRQNKKRKHSEEGANEDCTVHVWFTLLKYNMEQQEASRRLGSALGVSTGQISTAGIKDRRGLTCQRCCATLHPRDLSGGSGEEGEGGVTMQQRKLLAVRNQLRLLNSSPMLKLVEGYLESRNSRLDWVPEQDIMGLAVGSIHFRQAPLRTGELWGNQFCITLRNVGEVSSDEAGKKEELSGAENRGEVVKRVQASLRSLEEGGFPNYFGSQRMGVLTKRDAEGHELEREECAPPPGPLIGKYLLLNQARLAVNTIILGAGKPVEMQTDTTNVTSIDRARALFAQHFAPSSDFLLVPTSSATVKTRLQEILALFPPSLSRETDLMRLLVRNSPVVPSHHGIHAADAAAEFENRWIECCGRALGGLSYGIKQLWVCSYQSWLWNLIADDALFHSAPERKSSAAVGDLVCVSEEGSKHSPRVVSSFPPEVSPPRLRNVVLPNIGKRMLYPENKTGERYLCVLQEEGLLQWKESGLCHDCTGEKCTISCRINRGLAHLFHKSTRANEPSLGIVPRGSYRRLMEFPRSGSVQQCGGACSLALQLEFALPSGSYATAFLRELFCNDHLI